jgi:hypothetical protein
VWKAKRERYMCYPPWVSHYEHNAIDSLLLGFYYAQCTCQKEK